LSALSSAERKALKAKAHALKPVVWVGEDGITPGVVAATDEALEVHELIKVRLRGATDKAAALALLAGGTDAALVGSIGHIGILFRKRGAPRSDGTATGA
jgi:RNA-binding protein